MADISIEIGIEDNFLFSDVNLYDVHEKNQTFKYVYKIINKY